MIRAIQHILEGSLDRLGSVSTAYLPPLLAGAAILLVAFAVALLARWILLRVTRASRFERFLVQSGLSSMLARSGRVRVARLVSSTAYWLILLVGLLTALSAFNTTLTSRMVETTVFLLPKLVTAAAIVLAGIWLGQYFGRSVLVWACNEDMPHPRRLAAGVRILVVFVAVAVAADHLDFARNVFLAGFILVVGGAVLALAIAGGLAMHDALRRRLDRPAVHESEPERSLWNHL